MSNPSGDVWEYSDGAGGKHRCVGLCNTLETYLERNPDEMRELLANLITHLHDKGVIDAECITNHAVSEKSEWVE